MSDLRRLYKTREKIKKLEEESERLREEIIKEMGRKKTIEEGGYKAIIKNGEREFLDKSSLAKYLGKKLDRYKRITHYKKLKIEKAS